MKRRDADREVNANDQGPLLMSTLAIPAVIGWPGLRYSETPAVGHSALSNVGNINAAKMPDATDNTQVE